MNKINIHKKYKRFLHSKLFIRILFYLVQCYCSTFRLKTKNEEEWQKLIDSGQSVILCSWHQQFFSTIRHFKKYRKYNPAIIISQSRDGEIISAIANLTGWETKRGSSTRGGKKAMEMMIDHLKKGKLAAHILDGPLGPIGIVKPGVVKIAAESKALIVPVTTSTNKAWYVNSWDKFMIPKPFSKVTIQFGTPIKFAPPETEDAFETIRKNIEKIMLPDLAIPTAQKNKNN